MTTVFISFLPPSFLLFNSFLTPTPSETHKLFFKHYFYLSTQPTEHIQYCSCARVFKADHLGLDDLMRLIAEEKRCILNSPSLPVVLHLHAGPSEIFPSVFECEQVLSLGATFMLCREDTVLQQASCTWLFLFAPLSQCSLSHGCRCCIVDA